ncbi:MAG: MurR/RpiR family transcriptional regulator [Betaproteobacteria bacterium]
MPTPKSNSGSSARQHRRAPAGDLLAAMRERTASLSQAQQQVATAMLDDPDFALRANVDALARRAAVSPPTITRFCRALGYPGLREFKLHLAHTLATTRPTLHRAVKAGDDMQTVTHKVLQEALGTLSSLERHLAPEDLERASTRIARARRVDCYGVGNVSMFMASDAQARFARLGMNSGAYFDAHLQLISAATMNKNDVVLAIAYTGRMRSLLQAIEVAKEQGALVVAITQPQTPLARLADIVLPVMVPLDSAMRVGTEAYLAQLTYLEILMVGVGLRRGPAAFRQLKRVRQVLKERGSHTETWPVMPVP